MKNLSNASDARMLCPVFSRVVFLQWAGPAFPCHSPNPRLDGWSQPPCYLRLKTRARAPFPEEFTLVLLCLLHARLIHFYHPTKLPVPTIQACAPASPPTHQRHQAVPLYSPCPQTSREGKT